MMKLKLFNNKFYQLQNNDNNVIINANSVIFWIHVR